MAKRCLDLTVAVLLIVLLAPLGVAVAGVVVVALGRPILFRQVRPGRGSRPFTIYKFRTMRQAVPGEPDDDAYRLTRAGRMLRACSLDELPELWNVVRGDMSLVGPRPLLTSYLDHYTPRQARRHEVRPGITGLAQVSGRNGLSWEDKFELDVRYVEEHSIAIDLRILLRTARVVLQRRGISAEGHATAPMFLGSGPVDVRSRRWL